MRLANANLSAQDLAMAIANIITRNIFISHISGMTVDKLRDSGSIFAKAAKAADILVNIWLEIELSAIAILSPPASTFLSPARVLRTPSVLTSKPQMLAVKTAHTLGPDSLWNALFLVYVKSLAALSRNNFEQSSGVKASVNSLTSFDKSTTLLAANCVP